MTTWAETEVGLLHGFVRASDVETVRAQLSTALDTPTALVTEGALTALLSLRPVAPGGAAALASLFADAELAAALALTHHDVLAAASAVGDVLPVRIGSIYVAADGVRRLIARDHAVFATALDGVAGAVEWGVRLMLADAPAVKVPRPLAPAEGRNYLRQIAEADRARREHGQRVHAFRASVIERLRGIARRIVARPVRQRPDATTILADLAVLVARGQEDRLRSILSDSDAAALGITLSCTGPWPPYSFVALPESEAACG